MRKDNFRIFNIQGFNIRRSRINSSNLHVFHISRKSSPSWSNQKQWTSQTGRPKLRFLYWSHVPLFYHVNMNLFHFWYESFSTFLKRSIAYEHTVLLHSTNQEDVTCQLSRGKKVQYVSLIVFTDMVKAFKLTGLSLWHQKTHHNLKHISLLLESIDTAFVYPPPPPSPDAQDGPYEDLWMLFIMVANRLFTSFCTAFLKTLGKIVILQHNSCTQLTNMKAFSAFSVTKHKNSVEHVVWKRGTHILQWSSLDILERFLFKSAKLRQQENIIVISSQTAVDQCL